MNFKRRNNMTELRVLREPVTNPVRDKRQKRTFELVDVFPAGTPVLFFVAQPGVRPEAELVRFCTEHPDVEYGLCPGATATALWNASEPATPRWLRENPQHLDWYLRKTSYLDSEDVLRELLRSGEVSVSKVLHVQRALYESEA